MNTSYKKILNKSKLILSDFDTDNFSQNYLIKMLINNNISGLLPTELNMVDSKPLFSYDITSKHSVMSVLENKKIDYSLLSSILQGLHRLCYTLNEFMLDSCYLLLAPEYIFFDGGMKQVFFCYCPVCESNNTYSFTEQLKHFFEYVISKLNYNDKDCVALVYSLHQKCVEDNICADDLIYVSNEDIQDLSENNFQKTSADSLTDNTELSSLVPLCPDSSITNLQDDIFVSDSSSFYICRLPASNFFTLAILGFLSLFTIIYGIYLFFIKNAISPSLAILICLSGPIIFLLFSPLTLKKLRKKEPLHIDDCPSAAVPEEFFSSESKKTASAIMPIGETILINPNKSLASPHLIYNGNDFGEDIELTEFPVTRGKLSDSVNHIIDNSLISRIHARFYLKEDCYYVEDLNSSNGTYINNVPLSPHTMTEIHDGDYIAFACLTYIFKLC